MENATKKNKWNKVLRTIRFESNCQLIFRERDRECKRAISIFRELSSVILSLFSKLLAAWDGQFKIFEDVFIKEVITFLLILSVQDGSQ